AAAPEPAEKRAREPRSGTVPDRLRGIAPRPRRDRQILHRQPQLLLVLLERLAQGFTVLGASHFPPPSDGGAPPRGGGGRPGDSGAPGRPASRARPPATPGPGRRPSARSPTRSPEMPWRAAASRHSAAPGWSPRSRRPGTG